MIVESTAADLTDAYDNRAELHDWMFGIHRRKGSNSGSRFGGVGSQALDL
jgi:hypothetical protein